LVCPLSDKIKSEPSNETVIVAISLIYLITYTTIKYRHLFKKHSLF